MPACAFSFSRSFIDLLAPGPTVAVEDPSDMDHKSSKLLLGVAFATPLEDAAMVGAIVGVELFARTGGEVDDIVVGRMGGEATPPNIDV